jgi:putative membrane protein
MHHHHHGTANPLREIIIGAAAGVGAAYAMDRFQYLWSRYGNRVGLPGGSRQEGVESAPEKVADMAVVAATGERLPAEQREQAGQAVHYATGAALGAAYGVIASSVRGSTLGSGLPFGAAVFFLLDQGLVPRLRLGYPAGRNDKDQKTYELASHLVFGWTLDSLRRVLGAR